MKPLIPILQAFDSAKRFYKYLAVECCALKWWRWFFPLEHLPHLLFGQLSCPSSVTAMTDSFCQTNLKCFLKVFWHRLIWGKYTWFSGFRSILTVGRSKIEFFLDLKVYSIWLFPVPWGACDVLGLFPGCIAWVVWKIKLVMWPHFKCNSCRHGFSKSCLPGLHGVHLTPGSWP